MSTERGGTRMVCSVGCCAGCEDCYGMSIGCHQDPCRCSLPCTCRYADEDTDYRWRDGCERHNPRWDQRPRYSREEPDDDDLRTMTAQWDPCPECGQVGPCGYDDEGRPMIHPEGATPT